MIRFMFEFVSVQLVAIFLNQCSCAIDYCSSGTETIASFVVIIIVIVLMGKQPLEILETCLQPVRSIIVQSIYRWTHHKLQQKVFLRIHYQKGLQNNILRIEENRDGRTSFFSAKSKMAVKHIISSIIQ